MNRPPSTFNSSALGMILKMAALQLTSLTQPIPITVGSCSPIEVIFNKVMSSFALSFASRLIVLCGSDHTQMVGANTEAITTDVVNNETGFDCAVMGQLIAKAMGCLVPSPRIPIASAMRDR